VKQIQPFLKDWRYTTVHLKDLILGDISKGVSTCSKFLDICVYIAFLSYIEPKNILEVEGHSYLLFAIPEELNKFKSNQV